MRRQFRKRPLGNPWRTPGSRASAMTRGRRLSTGLVLLVWLAVLVSACRVAGTAQPDADAIALLNAPSLTATPTAAMTRVSSAPPSRLGSTIEDHSAGQTPPSTPRPSTASRTTVPAGPTVTVVNDGYAASIMVTTIWSRALAATGAKVGIRTIDRTADQIAALMRGQVDLVQQYNSGLLNYLDERSQVIGQSAVDAAISAKLPSGLSVLNSTPATDDIQMTVSAGTAARYRLRSISDLGGHLADITLLLPDDPSARTVATGLTNYYGLTFADTRTTDVAGPKTIAAIRSSAAVGLMAASQYQIDDNKFVVLTDPEHLFLPENFIPVIGGKKITSAMKATINAVSARLSVAELRSLRRKVATGQGGLTEVADAWLASVGLK